jgi:hypothetical protein
VTVIADRESDIYEALAQALAGVEMLVRAAQDRALDDGGLLFARLDALLEAARQPLELPARGGRKARTAQMAVRWVEVDLARPGNRPAGSSLPRSVRVTLVDVREVDASPDAPALHWRLITTGKLATAKDAFDWAGLYRRRWAIEQLFEGPEERRLPDRGPAADPRAAPAEAGHPAAHRRRHRPAAGPRQGPRPRP